VWCLRGCVRVALHCYIVSDGSRVNADKHCVGSRRYTCTAVRVGFKWDDTLEEETAVERVTVTFQPGYDDTAVARIASLNNVEQLPYVSTLWGACAQPPDTPRTLIFPGSHYNLMGANTFLLTRETGCLGFVNLRSGNTAAGNWAEVCVYGGVFRLDDFDGLCS
jgi:hypothetical protein